MERMFDRVDKLFYDVEHDLDLRPFLGRYSGIFSPLVDVIENDKEYIVTAELPGMEEKDIELRLTEYSLQKNGCI